MPPINGRLLCRDIMERGYTKRSLVAEINVRYPGANFSEKYLQRAASPKHEKHHISEQRLLMVADVLETTPDRYAVDQPVTIFTRHSRREQFRSYMAILQAIDDNRVPERCWDYYVKDGSCFRKHVLTHPQQFSTNMKISPNDWDSAFVHCKLRDIVMQLPDATYRIVGARGEEMLVIIEFRTYLECLAARHACSLGTVERRLIVQEMDQVLEDCHAMLQEAHPPKDIIESEAQFHLTWAGSHGAIRRLLHYVLEVCKQLGDRLLRLDDNDEITVKPNYAHEFNGMASELTEMRNAFDVASPDPDQIERIIRRHTERSKQLTRNHPIWFNSKAPPKFKDEAD